MNARTTNDVGTNGSSASCVIHHSSFSHSSFPSRISRCPLALPRISSARACSAGIAFELGGALLDRRHVLLLPVDHLLQKELQREVVLRGEFAWESGRDRAGRRARRSPRPRAGRTCCWSATRRSSAVAESLVVRTAPRAWRRPGTPAASGRGACSSSLSDRDGFERVHGMHSHAQ